MDYRILMLQEPVEIKKILDEFGGNLAHNKQKGKKGWLSGIFGRVVGSDRENQPQNRKTAERLT